MPPQIQAPVPSIRNYLVKSVSEHKLDYAAVSLISLIQTGANLVTPFLFVGLWEKMQEEGDENRLQSLPWLLGLCGAILTSQAMAALRKEIITSKGSELANELGESVVEAYYALPLKRYISPANSSMVGYFGASILRISRAFIDGVHGEIVPALMETVSASILISARFGIVGAIVSGALAAHLLVLFAASPRMIKTQNQYMQALYGAMDDAINQVGQYLSVNIFNAVKMELKRLAGVLKDFGQITDRSILIKSRVQFASGLVHVLSLLSVGLFALYKSDKLSAEDFSYVFIYLRQLAPSFENLSRAVNELLAEREFFKGTVEYIKGGYDSQDNQKPALAITTQTASIEFKNVTLRYEDTKHPAVKQISFRVEAGEFVVITGESGAGKTSILSLVEKFYPPTDGEIFIAGNNIANVSTASVRDAFAVVPQDTLLLNISLRQNVAFANPNATPQEIDNAIQLAGLTAVLRKHGDNPIGVGGGKLSKGQCQRVAIARAIVRNAHCLFLDEPTASLDAKTEKEFLSQLAKLIADKKRTTVLITHRLAALKYLPTVNKVIVLHNGKIVEQGTTEQLMQKRGFFASQMEIALAQEKLIAIKTGDPSIDIDLEIDTGEPEQETQPPGAHIPLQNRRTDTFMINVDQADIRTPLIKQASPPQNRNGNCTLL